MSISEVHSNMMLPIECGALSGNHLCCWAICTPGSMSLVHTALSPCLIVPLPQAFAGASVLVPAYVVLDSL